MAQGRAIATGIGLVLVGGFGFIGSITGNLPEMLAALFAPSALVAGGRPNYPGAVIENPFDSSGGGGGGGSPELPSGSPPELSPSSPLELSPPAIPELPV